MVIALGLLCITAYTQCVNGQDTISSDYLRYNNGLFGHHPRLEYQSSQEYSPLLQVNIWNESAIDHKAGSHILIRYDGDGLASPLILDSKDLSAVYMNHSFANVFGTRVQEDSGKKYLTFWEGKKGNGVGDGFGLVYDNTYRLVYNISAPGIATHADLHEFAFTGHGTVIVTAVDEVLTDMSRWGWEGFKKSVVLDSLFQEIDLKTNKLLFSWRALEHVNPINSFERRGPSWDIYHLNSVQKTQKGNYLVSFRHTSSIVLIDGRTGDIIWALGGKHNDFTEIPSAEGVLPVLTMSHQHHARFVPNTDETEITLFDNHGDITSIGKCQNGCSRGLHIAINDTSSPPTVQLLQEFYHPSQLKCQSQGSAQALSSIDSHIGNVFIGWGHCPSFTEHTPTGETVMNVQFSPWHSYKVPDALDNYRAYKLDWAATPWWNPAIALKDDEENNKLDVYVSWNGATEVSEWVVRRGNSSVFGNAQGDILARSPRTGFETTLAVDRKLVDEQQYIWAEAVDKNGSILRSTDVWGWDDNGNMIFIMSIKQAGLEGPSNNKNAPVALKTWILLVFIGLLALGLGLAVKIIMSRRQKGYDRLEMQDRDMGDYNSAFGLEDLPDQSFAADSESDDGENEDINDLEGTEGGAETVK